MKKVLLTILVLGCMKVQAQNNAIFNGGIADGWDRNAYQQAANNIYTGGSGDGWSYQSFAQASNAIFNGGNADGWGFNSFAQTGNSIFSGGGGDGWASNYRPMGSLPVTFISFTASKQHENAALLQWQTSQELNSSHFEIERSEDALHFVHIGRVNAAGNTGSITQYHFTDMAPARGFNYYRLKQADIDGRFVYTPVRSVHFDQLNPTSIKYFPNPTNGMLNVEIPDALKPVDKVINIVNSNGLVMQQVKTGNSGNIIQLHFGHYPKGVYFVQLSSPGMNSTHRIVLQ